MIRPLTTYDRRVFLGQLGLSTLGLCVGFRVLGAEKTNEPDGDDDAKPKTSAPEVEKQATGLNPNVFIHVAATGVVSIVCHRSEMGQGIRSSLPVLMADELGADMKDVRIVQADGDKIYGDQNTDGSNSVRGMFVDMRRAAATARTMLVAAAAQRWNVQPETCSAQNHAVIHGASKRQLAFGELSLEASKLPIPKPATVRLRPLTELKSLGQALPIVDGPDYVAGKAIFGADVRLPKMLIAAVARPPVVGGRVKSFDAAAALAIPGVRKILEIPAPSQPYMFKPWGGIAVLADNTWAAIQGRNALMIKWDHGSNRKYDSQKFRQTLIKSASKPGKTMRKVGDVDRALKTAARTLEATYCVPHLPHVSMEPPVALANFDKTKGHCEIWAPTQNPQAARSEAARMLGVSEDKVTVHVTLLGGGFGRKSKADFVSEAAYLSQQAGVPVRVQWTREDDIHNDYLNTVSAQHLVAALDAKGKVTAWRHRTAFPPIASLFDPAAKFGGHMDLHQGVLDLALDIPNITADACEAEAHVRTGWLRSVYNIFHAFATCSFMDEIAHARGSDPKDTLLEIFGPARQLSLKELGITELENYGVPIAEHPVDAGRLRRVVERVTEMAAWDKRAALKGRGFGLAAHRSFLSYVGVVASVTQKENKELWVDEVWIVIDAGTVINTDRVRAQMEASVINGMNHALYGGVTHKNGAVEQNNFDGVQLVRMGVEPRKIHVDIVKSVAAPGGVGEPGVPPVAPAIANAIFALTGKRHRTMPFV